MSKNPYSYLNKSDKELEAYLNKLKDAYYNTQALVSDEVFDDLVDELRKRNPKALFFSQVGYKSNNDVVLPYKMYSLDKITPSKDNFDNWVKKYPGPYTISDKLDGISCLVVKKNNKTSLYLRSTADEGSDISNLLPYINIDVKPLPNNNAIRGELIISRENFKKISDQYKSPRMGVNGIIKRKTINKTLLKYVDFVGYSVVEPRMKQTEQYQQLQKWGFKTTHYHSGIKKITVNSMVELLKSRKNLSEYDIDGIVICDDTKIYDYPTNRNPEYQIAFKSIYDEQTNITKIKEIIWNKNKFGIFYPKIIIEPVHILDATINRATAKNAKYVVENNLGPGATIKIIKSGDIIPNILEVLIPADKPQLPKEKYIWNAKKTHIMVPESHNSEDDLTIIKRRIISTMETLEVQKCGPQTVSALVELCGCKTLYDIVNVSMDDLKEHLGKNIGPTIYNSFIEKMKEAPLDVMMYASNSFTGLIGLKKIKLILSEIPDILTTKKDLYTEINNIKGFSDKSTKAFIDGLNNFKNFINEFNENQDKIKLKYDIYKPKTINTLKTETNKSSGNKSEKSSEQFDYKKVVMTGFRDKEMQEFIESKGASISGAVSGKTELVIVSSIEAVQDNSKYKKAVELKIPIMSKGEFINKYMK